MKCILKGQFVPCFKRHQWHSKMIVFLWSKLKSCMTLCMCKYIQEKYMGRIEVVGQMKHRSRKSDKNRCMVFGVFFAPSILKKL